MPYVCVKWGGGNLTYLTNASNTVVLTDIPAHWEHCLLFPVFVFPCFLKMDFVFRISQNSCFPPPSIFFYTHGERCLLLHVFFSIWFLHHLWRTVSVLSRSYFIFDFFCFYRYPRPMKTLSFPPRTLCTPVCVCVCVCLGARMQTHTYTHTHRRA